MKVVVDVGNTRIKWARVRGERLTEGGQAMHAGRIDAAFGEFASALPTPRPVAYATNVAGTEVESRLRVLFGGGDAAVTFVRPSVEAFGVRCAYADPSRLGADRWVAIIAAHFLIPGSACVIDAGTTVTLDAVSGDGRHLGGLIMAGPGLVADTLDRGTRGIGRTSTGAGAASGLALLGSSTNDAVAHGAMVAIAAGLDRAIDEVSTGLGEPLFVVLTGGGAPVLEPWLETEVSYRPDFVLEGLARISAAL